MANCDLCDNPPEYKCGECAGALNDVSNNQGTKVGAELTSLWPRATGKVWIGSGEDCFAAVYYS